MNKINQQWRGTNVGATLVVARARSAATGTLQRPASQLLRSWLRATTRVAPTFRPCDPPLYSKVMHADR
ncbi:MAG TPA: hypothetical protein VFQ30_11250 [Ktedonobacteraceae bacterium]|nr:hypothetical protein [Ktedonobacteraceae bacterium]